MAQTETPSCGYKPALNPDGPPCTFPRNHRGGCSWDLTTRGPAESSRTPHRQDPIALAGELHEALCSLDSTEAHARAMWLAGVVTGSLCVTAQQLDIAHETIENLQRKVARNALAQSTWATQHDALDTIAAAFMAATGKRPSETTVMELLLWHAEQKSNAP